ncbi:MAG: immunoglobulin-like domain-containing protein, partial [Culicoidibacterales bacterium]
GYDLGAEDIDLTEMWNNIYAYYMETASPYPVTPWLYSGVTIDKNENEPYGSFRSRLQFFIDMFDFVGPEKAMKDFNKAYRRALAKGPLPMTMTEFIIRTFSTSSGYNFASYFENKGFPVSQELKRWSFEQGFKNITSMQPLYGISTQAGTIAKAETARQALGLAHRYTLVPTAKAQLLNTNASLTVDVKAPDMSVLQGREVILYDGNTEINRQTIVGNKVVFNNVPLGEYTVKLPTMPTGLYRYDEFNYVTVTEKGATLEANYEILTQTVYRNDVNINFRGLGNALFTKINYNSQSHSIDVEKLGATPHAYYTTTYASYKIYDANNNVVDAADFNGKDNSSFKRTSPFLEGYKLEIFHSEPSRVTMMAEIDNQNIYKQTAKTATYTLRDGLFVLNGDKRTSIDILQDMLRTYLNNLVAKYGKDQAKTRIYNSAHANVIASTIAQMPLPDQQEILKEYPDLFQQLKIISPAPFTAKIGDAQSTTQTELTQKMTYESNGEFTAVADWKDVPVQSGVFSTGGIYPVHYALTDFFMFQANTDVMLTVATDTEKPVLSGIAPTVELVEGDTFDPKAGILATDNIDGDVTSKIVVSGTVDTTKAGTYTLTYTVTDKAGNSTTTTQTVTVKAKVNPDTEKPVLSGIAPTIELVEGDTFDPKAGISATDNIDGDVTSKIVVSGTVDTTKAGTYTLTYTVTDKAGNSTTTTQTVTVKAKVNPDTEKPVLSGIAPTVELIEGDTFDPTAGISATDNIDGDVTSKIVVSGTVDTTKVGTYTLTYTVTDKAGNSTTFVQSITVKAKVIPDTEKPVLSGIAPTVELVEGDPFDPKAGISATDNIDGDVTSKIVVSGTVDTTKVGTYTLTYTVVDKAGNSTTFVQSITVKAKVIPDTEKPVLSGIAPTVELIEGDTFDPTAGISATDNIDGDVTSKIVVSGTVDTTKTGTYTLTYTVTDKAGNSTTATQTVTVKAKVIPDTEKPVLSGIAPTVELVEGDTFDSKSGISATDNIDGDVTSKIVMSGTVDTTKAGTYTLTYTVVDKAGNSTTTTQTVTVKAKVIPDTEKPVLNGIAPTVELVEGDTFDPKAGISATDNIDGDVTSKIVVSGTVDTTKSGTYTLTYTVTDKAGNSTTFVQSITVKAKVNPMARIEIIKIDKKSAVSLAGVEFDIRDLNGKIVDHIITNTQGKALSKYLVLGSYTLFETKTPVGYISDMMPIIVTLSKENAIITIVNESLKEDKKPDVIKGKLIISKFDKETGHRLSGMVFKLKHRITGQEKIIDMQDYNVFEITDMAEGEYDVVEMRAPAGYEIDSTIYTITIAKNGDVKLLSIYDLRKSETKVAPQVEEKKGNIALPQTGVDHNENMMKLLLVGIISFVLAIIVCFRNRNLK